MCVAKNSLIHLDFGVGPDSIARPCSRVLGSQLVEFPTLLSSLTALLYEGIHLLVKHLRHILEGAMTLVEETDIKVFVISSKGQESHSDPNTLEREKGVAV